MSNIIVIYDFSIKILRDFVLIIFPFLCFFHYDIYVNETFLSKIVVFGNLTSRSVLLVTALLYCLIINSSFGKIVYLILCIVLCRFLFFAHSIEITL